MTRDRKVNERSLPPVSAFAKLALWDTVHMFKNKEEGTVPESPFLILLLIFIVVMTGSIYAFTKLASKMVTRAIQDRLHALQEVVEGRIPDVWLRPFQRRVATLRNNTASEAQFARLGGRIQKHCLRHLDEMTRYVTNINMVDSEVTKQEIVGLLKTYRQTWPNKDWREWIADVEEPNTPRATEEDQTDSLSAD